MSLARAKNACQQGLFGTHLGFGWSSVDFHKSFTDKHKQLTQQDLQKAEVVLQNRGSTIELRWQVAHLSESNKIHKGFRHFKRIGPVI